MSKLLLIDGSNYLFRAFHALPPLTTSAGEPTGALRGFVAMLGKVYAMAKPDYAAIIFDAPGKTFRHEMYPEYKAQRPPMPDELRVQIEPLLNVIPELGWPLLQVSGVEADDVMGTLATKAEQEGMEVILATGDKDMAQLVNEKITLLNTMNNKFYDIEGVKEKYGVPPAQIIDYLALMGDKVDNVPGIEKCGPKTAAKWLNEFGSIAVIREHVDEFTGKIGEYLRQGLPFLDDAVRLVTIKTDCDLPEDYDTPQKLLVKPANGEAVDAFCERWEMSPTTVRRGAPAGIAGAEPRRPKPSAPSAMPSLGGLFAASETTPPASPVGASAHGTTGQLDLFGGEPTPTQSLLEMEATTVPASDAVPFTVVSTREDCEAMVKILTETERVRPDAVMLAYTGADRHPEITHLAIALNPNNVWVMNTSTWTPEDWALLKPWAQMKTPKVFADAKAMRHALEAMGLTIEGLVDDVLLMGYVLEAHRKHTLSSLCERWVGRALAERDWGIGLGTKKKAAPESEEAVLAQMAEEVASMRALDAVLRQSLHLEERLMEIYRDIERPLMDVLYGMENRGVLVDKALLKTQSNELKAKLDELTAQAYELAGEEFNLASPKQLSEVLFTKLGLPVKKKTASGAPSTNEEVLTELALDYPLPKIILDVRSYSKLKSTYLDALPKEMDKVDGRIHTTFGQMTAVTGRLTSSEPNLQNIPVRTPEGRRIREAFVAPEGSMILSADYSQIELRIMAHLSEDPGLLKAFAEGKDIHRATAAEVFGVTTDEVSSDQRRMAKVINFGLIYGMSQFGLAQNLGVSRDQAKHYIDQYFARYPGVKRYMDTTRFKAKEEGYVETVFGRRLYLPDINNPSMMVQQAAERAAINAPMQGTAADLIKRAMLAVNRFLEEGGYQSKMILQIHDELILEVPEAEVELMRTKIPELMSQAASLSVPLIAEVGIAKNWEAAH